MMYQNNTERGQSHRLLTPLLCLLSSRVVVVSGLMSPLGILTARHVSPHAPMLALSARAVFTLGVELPPLSPPIIELITPDGCSSSADTSKLVNNAKRAVEGGVKLVQLRDRRSDIQSIAELAHRLRDVTRERALFVVNGEPEDARAWGADGVHLPERMVDRLVRLRDFGEWPRVVGCSVHSAEAAVNAARHGADYVQVGTMFATPSHPGKDPEGVALLKKVRRHLEAEGLGRVLVIGVGGIDRSKCGIIAAAGADGVAAIRCLCDGEDSEGEARGLMEAFTAGTPRA